jgi:hypothetical protein
LNATDPRGTTESGGSSNQGQSFDNLKQQQAEGKALMIAMQQELAHEMDEYQVMQIAQEVG